MYLWPVNFSLLGYEVVFKTRDVWIGYANSIFYTVVGTLINIIVTMLAAYCLSRKDLPGRRIVMVAFSFTMIFNGGMIPEYLLVKELGMMNTRWALLLPCAISVYNVILARSNIQSNIPEALLEASQLDGCSDFRYFIRIVLPLSKANIAVMVLLYGVAHWNSYFDAMIYLHDKSLYPLTLYLKEILQANTVDPSLIADEKLAAKMAELANVMKYSLIIVSMLPILLVYPFIQKYFVQGMMIGSLKE